MGSWSDWRGFYPHIWHPALRLIGYFGKMTRSDFCRLVKTNLRDKTYLPVFTLR